MTLVWLLLIGSAGLSVTATQEQPVTFYVQLIRGTDAATPPSPEARPVGPALDQRLRIFKWRNYWEIDRRTVVVKPGGRNRQRLTPQREVEIALTSPRSMTVSLYNQGKLSRQRKQSANTAFFIAGGDRDNSESWFIVVRRDNPEMAQANLK